MIDIVAQGGNTLTYSIDNGVTYNANSLFTELDAGSYVVAVLDSKGCNISYQATRHVTLTEPNRIEVQSISVDSASCHGYNDAQVQIFATGGTQKKYSINGGTIFNSTGIFSNLTEGYYNSIVTDSNNCPATYDPGVASSGSIGAPDILNMSGVSKTDLSCNNSGDGSITITASGGTNRKYSLDGGLNYQSSPVFNGLTAGSYTITLSDINSCPPTYATSRVVIISQPDEVVVSSVVNVEPSCNGSNDGR